ncbi:sporulation initiation inhibitor protein Soj (plasmid) [Fulvitalea axinellae]|uniref:Sporulation initiation inhibitor protein Soj n=1 Tax=Fulvitalea axinellae TaxID=1182444 RepID=A0AAU9CM69_9BACT|nr:sporulation initiation inhibitor protein Soj [Fulvitalea axinellae]
MAKIISIINHKGGVAKTTTTINLGKALALLGNRVLLVDLDPQGNLSQGLGHEEPEEQVVHALLEGAELPQVPISENLWLAPSDLELVDAELRLNNEIGGFGRLRKALRAVKDNYDYILIDCPPSLNIVTQNGMVASDSVIITIAPSFFAMKGLQRLMGIVEQVREEIHPDLEVEGIVFTLVEKRLVIHKSVIDYIGEATEGRVRLFQAFIRKNVALEESNSNQTDIFTYDKTSNGAADYMALAEELASVPAR